MELEKIPSNRNYVYYHEGFLYTTSSSKRRKYLTCYQRNCTAKIITNFEKTLVLKSTGVHLHQNQEKERMQKKFLAKLRKRCTEETKALSVIYQEELMNFPIEVTQTMPYREVVRKMQRWHRTTYPANPNTFAEMDAMLRSPEHEEMARSHQDEHQFYRGMINNHSLLFLSEGMKTILLQPNVSVNIDGTFKAVPDIQGAHQMLTVMGAFEGMAFPVAWIIMQRKTVTCYREVLEALKQEIPGMNPGSFIMDFERSLHNAVRQSFPGVRIVGCWFHYTQALRRKRTSLGLSDEALRQNLHLQRAYEMSKALALLPADDITTGINIIEETANGDHRAQQFIQYLRHQWEPLKDILSVFNLPRRTNNELEAYHGQVVKLMFSKRRAGRPAPYLFCQSLRTVERATRNNYAALNSGRNIRWPGKRTYRQHDERIRAAMAVHLPGDVESVRHFLSQMRHHTVGEESGGLDDEYQLYEVEVVEDNEDNAEDVDGDLLTLEDLANNPENNGIFPAPAAMNADDFIIEEDGPEHPVIADPPVIADNLAPQNTVNEQLEAEELHANAELDPGVACVTCMFRQKSHAVLPCGHLAVCGSCAEVISREEYEFGCPICRHNIERCVRIYQ